MHFGETLGLLLVVTVAIMALRPFWLRLPRRAERAILLTGAIVVLLRLVSVATLWSTVWPRLNAIICWLSVIAYELVLMRFSLMRPRWLTSLSALILLVPLIGSSLLFPLTGLFSTDAQDLRRLSANYDLDRSAWDPKMGGRTGYDYGLMYRPSWIPFLHHVAQRSSFSDEQCRSADVTATLDLEHRLVHFHCPANPGTQGDIDLRLPLR